MSADIRGCGDTYASDNRPARWLYSMRGYEVVKHVDLKPGQMR